MAKRRRRISGLQSNDQRDFEYAVLAQSGWSIDMELIRQRIDHYLKEAAESGKYSISGLCIALGITRSRLTLWRDGFVNEADARETAVDPNEDLGRSIEMAMLHIQRYWEERDKPSSMDLKQLEASGALSEGASGCAAPQFDLGKLKKYAK